MKSEFAIWRDELATPKLSIAQRVAQWFDRPAPEPEPAEEVDPYVWHSVAELIERAAREARSPA